MKQAESEPHEPGDHEVVSRWVDGHVIEMAVGRVSHASRVQVDVDGVVQPDFVENDGPLGECEIEDGGGDQ